jgi:nucleoside-diphosphate-sugar epimerase
MAKVLVTGASGFIGLHLVRALVAQGDEVTALVRKTSRVDRIQSLGVRHVYGDVTDLHSLRDALRGQAIVYHVAGLNAVLRVRQFSQVNEQGTRNVARACADQACPPTLVIVSSLAAAGPSPRGRLRDETHPPNPVSHYGRSKWAGEEAARQYAGVTPITVVRPPIVFGQTDRQCLLLFLSVAKSRIHFVPGYAPRKFSLIHADDLAALLILAAQRGERLAPSGCETESPTGQGCYFAASNEHPTYYQLGHMIGEALGRRRTFSIPWPSPVVWLVAAVAELMGRVRRRPAYFGIDKAREALAGEWACSAQKAAQQLGFSVSATLLERLRQTARWYQQEGWI